MSLQVPISVHLQRSCSPKEVLAKLKVGKGDTLYVTETPGGVALTPYDPAFEEQLELGREFLREYRDTFRALAK